VFLSGFGILACEAIWEMPAHVRYLRGSERFSRLLLFDMRGSGLSDPLGPTKQLTLEPTAMDLLALLDDVGSDRAALVANNLCGLLGVYFAASFPSERRRSCLTGATPGSPQRPTTRGASPTMCWSGRWSGSRAG
jgi:pimeloyl-ACP methyl ester carboxylesterase